MDSVIISVFTRLALSHGCSADDILETPELREAFLAGTRRELGDLPEQELLHRLTNIRRARRLPKSRDLRAVQSSAA